MCGIVGYIGKKKVLPILMDGLMALEYRGYDSAGVAFLNNNEIEIVKSIGRINNLVDKIDIGVDSYIGIGHTRWATHGGVSLENCHPHRHGLVTLVHNGIFENYLEIKNELIECGYEFIGECDSEVMAAFIDYCYKLVNDKIKCLEMAKKRILGSYALGIIFDDDKDNIYALRKDSPLIVGISDDGNFIASDMPAIVKYTKNYILLDDGDIVVIGKDKYLVYNNGTLVSKDVLEFDYNLDMTDLGGFSHYMMKEINEEPSLVRNNLPDNLDDIPDLSLYDNIYIVGCGSAYHAGLVGRYLIENLVNKMVHVEIASEFRYKKLFLTDKDLVIFISQSGETADTIASLRIAKEYGAKTLGLVNVYGSSLAREADMVLYTNAGTEVAVATTKAYMMQVFMLGLMAIKGSLDDFNKYVDDYKILASQIDSLLLNKDYEKIAKRIHKNKSIFFLGRGIDYAIAMEGSLKLKEISYIHSEAYPAGELKHGTISLIDKDVLVVSIITDNKIKDKTISNIKEVISRGAISLVICSNDIDVDNAYYDMIVKVPASILTLRPILAIIPLQLIAYYVAKENGCDIDKPRNLAKSVTVE